MQHIYTQIRPSKGPSGHTLGVPDANRLEELPSDGLSPGPLSKRPFSPDFSAFRNRLPPGLGTQTGNTLWLEKERSWGWFFFFFFFLPFLHNIMTPI